MIDTIDINIRGIAIYAAVLFKVGAVIYFIIVIRLALLEVQSDLKNGIQNLRKQLLAMLIILGLINSSGLIILAVRPLLSQSLFNATTDTLIVINSVGFFIVGKIIYDIWSQQYTPEQKEYHRIIAGMEEKN